MSYPHARSSFAILRELSVSVTRKSSLLVANLDLSPTRSQPVFDSALPPLVDSVELRLNPHCLDASIPMYGLSAGVLDVVRAFPNMKYLGIDTDASAALSKAGQQRIRTLTNTVLVSSDFGSWHIDPSKRKRLTTLELVVDLDSNRVMHELFDLNSKMRSDFSSHTEFGLSVVCPVADATGAITTIRNLSNMKFDSGLSTLMIQIVFPDRAAAFTPVHLDRVRAFCSELKIDVLVRTLEA